MVDALLTALGISLAIQAGFFLLAAALQTDRVTDLSYGLTFVVLAVWLVTGTASSGPPHAVLAGMVIAWGLRLAGYLFYRIILIGRDPRFDGVREHFLRFLRFWVLQGVAAWVIMLPALLWFELAPAGGRWSIGMTMGAAVWLAGFVIEATADRQKFRYKIGAGDSARWMHTGLWRYSRHPNYFGELLCWWGVFVFVLPDLGAWALVALAGPVGITLPLLYVTGIPTLEASAERKWGHLAEYRRYVARTSRLILRPPGDA